MSRAVKPRSHLYRQGNEWFCNAALASDIVVIVDGVKFHLHKFPLLQRCGRIANLLKESEDAGEGMFTAILQDFPGGPDNFLSSVRFCYDFRVELTRRNIVLMYGAATYLEMTYEFGEGNLLSKCEAFFHKNILRNWKECISALQSCHLIKPVAEKLQLITRCLDAATMMICTDPSLFGWPMRLYGSLQSPGGSILWNGINTGAKIRSMASDWWFEDISLLSLDLFEKLIKTMQRKGLRSENIAGSIMYYCRTHLPGLGRWHGGGSGKNRSLASSSSIPAAVDQKGLIEGMEKLLPDKKGKSFCRFLFGLLRNALILGVDQECRESLERRVGAQLDLATVDALLIPMYSGSDSDTLYDTDCVERIVRNFVNTEPEIMLFSPASLDMETKAVDPLKRVSALLDMYLAEVASDSNLKPEKMCSLVEALPESSRILHDGLYRALDIYFKEHPWLCDSDKEQLCYLIDYQRLSIEACGHASQNKRLPLPFALQVLYFEQMQLRSALASRLCSTQNRSMSAFPCVIPADVGGQIVHGEDSVPILRQNHVMKKDLESMRSRVLELEDEFSKMRFKMKRATKSRTSLSSPRILARKLGCKLLPPPSNSSSDAIQLVHTPRASLEKGKEQKISALGLSKHARHMRNISIG